MEGSFADQDYRGLVKVAFRMNTVGDVINAMNADMSISPFQRRQVIDEINRRRIDVKQPASRLTYMLAGSVVANIVARYMGAGGVMRGIATVAGAAVGNHLHNKRDPNVVNGYRMHVY